MKLTTGKYKDKEIKDVPTHYLLGMMEHSTLEETISDEIQGQLRTAERKWDVKSNIIKYGFPLLIGMLGLLFGQVLFHLYQDHIGFHQLVQLEIQRQQTSKVEEKK